MLDITTNNQTTSNIGYYGYGYGISADDAAAELLDDDMMDPLFDEDWLHENNLDLLFDLFEEEIESKVGVDSNNGSSSLFGSSPITSYLFGTSPSLASALDLLYFDNQQQAINNNSNNSLAAQPQQQQFTNSQVTIAPAAEASTVGSHKTSTKNNPLANNNCKKSISNNTFNVKGNKSHSNKGSGSAQQVSLARDTNHMSNSITNAMRIKRGMKRGQSEGVSLLAKPFSSNSVKTSGASGSTSSSSSGSSSSKNSTKIDKTNSIDSKNNSDKTSAKITNFKSSIIIGNNSNLSNRNGIDINYSKQAQQQKRERYYLHNCQQHAHYITGRAVIHEHAYAVRGH